MKCNHIINHPETTVRSMAGSSIAYECRVCLGIFRKKENGILQQVDLVNLLANTQELFSDINKGNEIWKNK